MSSHEEFHDYTLATRLEKFVAVLEQTLRSWEATGLETIITKAFNAQLREQPTLVKVQASLKHRLPWRSEPYILQLHLPTQQLSLATAMQQRRRAVQAAAAQQQQQQVQRAPPRQGEQAHASSTGDRLSTHAVPATQSAPALGEASQLLPKAAPPRHRHGLQMQPLKAAAKAGPSSRSSPAVSSNGAVQSSGDQNGVPPADSAWEVGVDLDMSELLTHINEIMADDDTESESVAPSVSGEESGADVASITPGHTSTSRQAAEVADDEDTEPHTGSAACKVAAPVTVTQISNAKQPPVAAVSKVPSMKLPHAARTEQPIAPAGPPAVEAGRSWAQAGPSSSEEEECSISACWWPLRQHARPWWRFSRQHKLQRWLGVDAFVVLMPNSYSRRILDEVEAATLLAALTCALDSLRLPWPALLPVHDALRDAYWGAAVVPGVVSLPAPRSLGPLGIASPTLPGLPQQTRLATLARGGRAVRFNTDSVHISGLPGHLTSLSGQLALFSEQLAPVSAVGAAACTAAAALHAPSLTGSLMRAVSERHDQASGSANTAPGAQVTLSACYTFKLPEPSDLASVSRRCSEDSDAVASSAWGGTDGGSWDVGAPWQPWASHSDPIRCLEVDLVWEGIQLYGPSSKHSDASSSSTAEPELQVGHEKMTLPGHTHVSRASIRGRDSSSAGAVGQVPWPLLVPSAAHHWVVHALKTGFSYARSRGLGLRSAERQRTYVELQRGGVDWLWTADGSSRNLKHGISTPTHKQSGRQLNAASFSAMLCSLLSARTIAAEAPSLGELAGDAWWWDVGNALAAAKGGSGAAAAFTANLSLPAVPPENVLQEVLHDMFHPDEDTELPDSGPAIDRLHKGVHEDAGAGVQPPRDRAEGPPEASGPGQPGACQPSRLHFVRTAPLTSLLMRLALHCLLFGNARAVALLWQRFMRELRFNYWEECNRLPRMGAASSSGPSGNSGVQIDGSCGGGVASRRSTAEQDDEGEEGVHEVPPPPDPDLGSCLLHQKLQMLDICIYRRQTLQRTRRRQQRMLARAQQEAADAAAVAGVGPVTPHARGRRSVVKDDTPGGTPVMPQATQAISAPLRVRSHSLSASETLARTPQGQDDQDSATAMLNGFSGLQLAADHSLSQAEDGWEVGLSPSLLSPQPSTPPGAAELPVAAEPSRHDGAENDAALDVDGAVDNNSDFYSASEDEEAFCALGAQPRGALGLVAPGLTLARHPDRPARVPMTQPPPVYTEDRLYERQAQVEALLSGVTPEGAEAAARVTTEALVSDMAAFKASNPGAELEDFVRWHSPGDVLAGSGGSVQLSQRMAPTAQSPAKALRGAGSAAHLRTAQDVSSPAGQGRDRGARDAGGSSSAGTTTNPWHLLWATTAACPAWEQRPLQDAMVEGERVLHDLDTLSPADLFDQLVALGVAASVQLLAAAPGAQLPAVSELAYKYYRLSQGILKSGCSVDDTLWSAPHLPPHAKRMVLGFEDPVLEFLLAEFHFLEQAVVLAESLLRRLPGCASVAAAIMHSALEGAAADEEQGLFPAPSAAAVPAAGVAGGRASSQRQGATCAPDTSTTARPGTTSQGGSGSSAPANQAAGSAGHMHPPAVLRIYRPIALVSEPAARLALAALICPAAALSLGEQEASDALGTPRPATSCQGTHVSAQQPRQLSAGSPTSRSSGTGAEGGPMPPRARALMQQLLEPHWAPAAHREWVISVEEAGSGSQGVLGSGAENERENGGAQAVRIARPVAPCMSSRMYVQHAEGEMRIATTLVSDPVL